MTTLPLAEARIHFSKLVESAVTTHDRISVTRNGVPAVVILSDEDYEGMRATIETLADSEEMAVVFGLLAHTLGCKKIGRVYC